ncbi:hydroxymethylbilane synthase, partial [candidate division KSB1 bacterium]|nr:hydroxymethylbilane synthase [candidate division KSB1 bacterium]
MANNLRIGTRDSRLARWQTDYVINLLKAADPGLSITVVPIKTKGDTIQNIPLENMGVTGIFTKEIERALLDESIDIAVHSLKDLESTLPEGLVIAAVPIREDARDVLIAKEHESLEELPAGTQVMTGSLRRKAQLLNLRDDLIIVNIRGNVETRLKKFKKSGPDVSGLIMAAAGLKRLELTDRISSYIPEDVLVPAVGQGALAIEARKDDKKTL